MDENTANIMFNVMKQVSGEKTTEVNQKDGSGIRVGTVVGSDNKDTVYVNFPEEEGIYVEIANPMQIPLFPTSQVYVDLLNNNLTSSKINAVKTANTNCTWTLNSSRSSNPFVLVETSYSVANINMTPDLSGFKGSKVIINITDSGLVEREIFGIVVDFAYDIATVGSDHTVNIRLRILQQISSFSSNAVYNITATDTINSISGYQHGKEPIRFPLGKHNWMIYTQFITSSNLAINTATYAEQDSALRIPIPQGIEPGSIPVKWNLIYSGSIEASNQVASSHVLDLYTDIANVDRSSSIFGTYARCSNLGTTASGTIAHYSFEKNVLITAPLYNAAYSDSENLSPFIKNGVGANLNVQLTQGFFYIIPDVFI